MTAEPSGAVFVWIHARERKGGGARVRRLLATDLLGAYGRRSPLARLVPVLYIVAIAFLLGFTGFILGPAVRHLVDLHHRAAAAEAAAAAAESAYRSAAQAVAGVDQLAAQVEVRESQLVPAADLAGLAARLAALAADSGVTLEAIRFEGYEPLDEPAPSGADAEGDRDGEPTTDPATDPTGGGGLSGESDEVDGTEEGFAGSEQGASGAPTVPAPAEGAGSSDPPYGAVTFAATLRGPWPEVEAWLQRVDREEPAVWVEGLAIGVGDAGDQRVELSGRVWVTGEAPFPFAPPETRP